MKLLRPWRTWWPSRKEIQFSIFAPRRAEKRSYSHAQPVRRGRVIAADLHAHRVRAMAERFEAAGVRNVEPVTIDGAQPRTFERRFDRILVDAPCSGTGRLRGTPKFGGSYAAKILRTCTRVKCGS